MHLKQPLGHKLSDRTSDKTALNQASAAASKRRLLGDSSAAAVDVIVNGHGSSELASEMASNLTTAIQTGTFMVSTWTRAACFL